MNIYSYKNGRYLHEFIVRDGEEIFVSASPIDCTLFKPDENGAPTLIAEVFYSSANASSTDTASSNDFLFNAGNDTLTVSGNDTITYGNDE